MKFDYDVFFKEMAEVFGKLQSDQVEGLSAILKAIESEPVWDAMPKTTAINQVAYILATIKHECANKWRPIEEYGRGRGKQYGRADSETQKVYYGRGFVQLTWKKNYEYAGDSIGVDLINFPEKALEFDIAWVIASKGMREGWFTGRKLYTYINDDKTDFYHARKIINGLDRADTLAAYARRMVQVLKASVL